VVGSREDAEWIVGMAIWEDLTDRRGVKNELNACEDSIKAEIIETIGSLAIAAYRKLTADSTAPDQAHDGREG
jgi:hypothetical protein